MTITERHELQQDIAISNVLGQRNTRAPREVRKAMAYWMRQSRRLRDSELIRVARTL